MCCAFYPKHSSQRDNFFLQKKLLFLPRFFVSSKHSSALSSVIAQSRQSTRLFLQSSELGPPTPSSPGECVPPLLGEEMGGGGALFGREGTCGGGGASLFGRGDIHCGTLGILRYTVYFVMKFFAKYIPNMQTVIIQLMFVMGFMLLNRSWQLSPYCDYKCQCSHSNS